MLTDTAANDLMILV